MIAGSLRIGYPDEPVARALVQHWGAGMAVEPVVVPLEAAEAALRAGHVDLAFLPTLTVLRDPDAFTAVPGIALVGQAHESVRLHLTGGFDALVPGATPRIGLDPRYAQEALLAQVLLKELYNVRPQFVPVAEGVAAEIDAALLPPGIEPPEVGHSLALGSEWFELTTRPMVWALLVGTGGANPDEARYLRDAAKDLFEEPDALGTEEPTAVTLGAYAHAGLEAWAEHLFYHQALPDIPAISFVEIESDEVEPDDDDALD